MGWISKESAPNTPLTVIAPSLIKTSTSFGKAIGFLPIRDICLNLYSTIHMISPPIPSERACRSVITPFVGGAIAALTLEEGITTDTLLTICALRTRVNISEIGSLILIDIFPLSPALPTRFDYARNFSAECNLTDFAARQAKFPECPARTARKRAAVTLPGGIRVAR